MSSVPLATRPAGTGLATLLEKVASDTGFDLVFAQERDWLRFGSSHAPLEIWLAATTWDRPVAAFRRCDVAIAMPEHGTATTLDMPSGATAVRLVDDVPALYAMLRRAYQLARSLPDEILHVFEQRTRGMPRTTEAERLVVQRVGQNIFRAGLMEYWDGRCAVTGLAVPELLRASHIKPWAACESDAERLDVFNGLLLAPHLDAAFDAGLITFSDEGVLIVASRLSDVDRRLLGVDNPLQIARLTDAHSHYLAWHRAREFESRAIPKPPDRA